MIRGLRLAIGLGVIAAITVVATGATAGADGRSDGGSGTLRERLTGYEEAPLALSTTGTAEFRARIGPGDKITYTLRYSALEGMVTQAHPSRYSGAGRWDQCLLLLEPGQRTGWYAGVPACSSDRDGDDPAGGRDRAGWSGDRPRPVR